MCVERVSRIHPLFLRRRRIRQNRHKWARVKSLPPVFSTTVRAFRMLNGFTPLAASGGISHSNGFRFSFGFGAFARFHCQCLHVARHLRKSSTSMLAVQ